ncbi:hypothetical protein KIN20_000038 [Parelaphostrongylus tenuis]|uniref:Uncharacterized protein n=1 Tax=Parelaphostrongylus tenuis TaxID=148309 RepID=A0AAD5QFT9_PARTN|nr:hypothetical protein KIN20_000038 [Parelaphostrongylus tenuis]
MTESSLPLISQHFMIFSWQSTVFAKTTTGSALQLQLVRTNMTVVSRFHNTSRTVEVSDIVRCHTCLLGGKLNLLCTSSHEETTADITCAGELLAGPMQVDRPSKQVDPSLQIISCFS